MFILLAFLAQTFNKSFIVIDYYLNPSVFAQQCENKDKPQMHCNGHCQMMKKIKNEDKKDHQNPERKLENKNEITLSAKSYFAIIALPESGSSEIHFPDFKCGKEIKLPHSIFHPPAA